MDFAKKQIELLQLKFAELIAFLKRKHEEKVTVMLIPHTEKKILNFHISVLTISTILFFVVFTIVIAAIGIVSRSSVDHHVKELKMSNSEYKLQRQKIRQEIKPLHDLISEFTQLTGKLMANASGSSAVLTDAIGGPESEDLLEILDDDLDDIAKAEELGEELGISVDKKDFLGGSVEYKLAPEVALLKQGIHNLRLTKEWGKKTIELLQKQKLIIRHTPTIWPTKGHIMNTYGKYIDPYTGKQSYNRGIDIGALPGSEVLSTADGIVHRIYEHPRYGYMVEVKHRWGFKTVYGSLERVTVKTEDKIQKGEVVGFVGTSGFSTQPSVHYELWVGTSFLDPFPFLNKLVD